jgi:hypothetical protein
MSFICHHFFCHHKYTPYAHFCRFRFPFTSPLSLCTRKPHFTILNPFASARVNRPGTGMTKYGFSHSKPTPFQRYNFREDRRTPSADAPSAQRESIRTIILCIFTNMFHCRDYIVLCARTWTTTHAPSSASSFWPTYRRTHLIRSWCRYPVHLIAVLSTMHSLIISMLK